MKCRFLYCDRHGGGNVCSYRINEWFIRQSNNRYDTRSDIVLWRIVEKWRSKETKNQYTINHTNFIYKAYIDNKKVEGWKLSQI